MSTPGAVICAIRERQICFLVSAVATGFGIGKEPICFTIFVNNYFVLMRGAVVVAGWTHIPVYAGANPAPATQIKI